MAEKVSKNEKVLDKIFLQNKLNEKAIANLESCKEYDIESYKEYGIEKYRTNYLLTSLNLSNCELTQIEEFVFENLQNLTILKLNKNQLKHVEPNTFSGLFKLKILDLSDNQLTSIAHDNFASLTNLNELNLFNNHITRLDKNAFNHLEKLTILDLSNNVIEKLDNDAFMGLTKLTELYLFNNQLRHLAENTFNGLENLQTLNLFNNSLAQINANLFRRLKNLKFLEMSNNKIFSIDCNTFEHLENLSILLLVNNCLTSFDPKYVSGLDQLKILILSSNRLETVLMSSFFEQCLSLELLDLSFNPLVVYPEEISFERVKLAAILMVKTGYPSFQNKRIKNILDNYFDLTLMPHEETDLAYENIFTDNQNSYQKMFMDDFYRTHYDEEFFTNVFFKDMAEFLNHFKTLGLKSIDDLNLYVRERSLIKEEKSLEPLESLKNFKSMFQGGVLSSSTPDETIDDTIHIKKFEKIKNKLTWYDLAVFNNLEFLNDYCVEFKTTGKKFDTLKFERITINSKNCNEFDQLVIYKNGIITLSNSFAKSLIVKNRFHHLKNTIFLKQLRFYNRKFSDRLILSVLPDGCFSIFNAKNFEYLKYISEQKTKIFYNFKAHDDDITCIKELSNGLFVSGSKDKSIKIWDLDSGTCINTLNGHTGSVECLKTLEINDRKFLITGSIDQSVKIWDLSTYECVCSLTTIGDAVTSLKVESPSDVFVGTKARGILIYDLSDFSEPREKGRLSDESNKAVEMLKLVSDQDILGVYDDNTVRIWNLHSKECVRTHNNDSKINRVKIGASGNIFISSKLLVLKILNNQYDVIRIISFVNDWHQQSNIQCSMDYFNDNPDEDETQKGEKEEQSHSTSLIFGMQVTQIAVDEDRPRLANPYHIVSSSTDKNINLYLLYEKDLKLVDSIQNAHHRRINCVKFFHNYILSSSNDNMLNIWKLANDQRTVKIRDLQKINKYNAITKIKIFDANRFAFASRNSLTVGCYQEENDFKFFNINSRHTTETEYFKRIEGNNYVTISTDNLATVWQLNDDRIAVRFDGYLNNPQQNFLISCVKLTKKYDKNLIVCGYSNGSIILWTIGQNGFSIFTNLECNSSVTCLNIYRNLLTSTFQNGEMKFWTINDEFLLLDNNTMMTPQRMDRFAKFMKILHNEHLLVSYNNLHPLRDDEGLTTFRYVRHFPSNDETNNYSQYDMSCMRRLKNSWNPLSSEANDNYVLFGTLTGHLLVVPSLTDQPNEIIKFDAHGGEITSMSSKLQ